MGYRILTTTSSFGKVDPGPLNLLEEAGIEVVVNPYGRKLTIDESKALMPGFDGIIAGTEKLNEEVLSSTTDLKYLCRLGAGMDNVDFDAARKHDIKVENTPSAHVDGVAELTLGGILSSLRSISISHANLVQGTWAKPMGTLLKGKTVGIVGLGQVGCRLSELLKPFGVNIMAFDTTHRNESFVEKNGIAYSSLEDLVSQSDIITIHVPLLPGTKHIIDKAALAKARSNVLIVNTSRGGVIDEEALLEFLSNNPGASAYLDTFEKEPYDGPLTQVGNCMLTPHIGSYAREVRINMEIEAAQNVINYFSNES